MIGYVQGQGIIYWHRQIEEWIDGLVAAAVHGWSAEDKLDLIKHYGLARFASLQSTHHRDAGLKPILIDHLWIEM